MLALQPVIQRLVDKLCKKFEKCKGTDEVVPMECAFDAFTMDVITEYSLDTNLYVFFDLLLLLSYQTGFVESFALGAILQLGLERERDC